MDEWGILGQKLAAQRRQQEAQDRYNAAQANLQQAQSYNSGGGLGDVLSNAWNGITSGATGLWNAGAGVANSLFGGAQTELHRQETKNTMADASKQRNEIAKKYGYNSYSEAMNDKNIGQDFWDEIKAANNGTMDKLNQSKDSYVNSDIYKNLANMKQNQYAADAIRGENFLADALTAGAGGGLASAVGINSVQGALGGLADELENSEGMVFDPLGGNYSAGNLDGGKVLNTMLSSAAGGAAGTLAGGKLGKLGGSSNLGKVLGSNVGRGALAGAASGAVSAGTQTALEGGNLEQVLSNAANAGRTGALYGGITSGAMGLANKGFNKLSDKINKEKTPNVIGQEVEPVKEAPTVEDIKKVNLDPVKEAEYDRKYTVAKQRQGQALMAQYGVIDAPTARSVGDAGQVLTNLYDNYGLKTPAEVQYAAKKLTGNDGIVTKMTRKLASSAGDIPAKYNEADLDQLIINSGLGLDSTRGKAVKQQITSILDSTRMSTPDSANANDVLDMVKKLERKSADVAGKSGNNYHRATSEDVAAASVLNAVASDYKDRIWNNAQDISTALTPDAIKELKAVFPKNKTYQQGIDNIIAKSTNGQELRHTMADLVNGSKIANNSKMMANTTGAQMVKAATSANPIVAGTQMLAIKALDSDTANKVRADKYAKKAQKAMAKLTGENVSGGLVSKIIPDNLSEKITSGVDKFANSAINTTNLADSQAGNFVGALTNATQRNAIRQNAVDQSRRASDNLANQNALQQAEQDVQGAQTDYENAGAQMQQALNDIQTYNSQQMAGQSQLDRIAQGMDRALAAGDLQAYSQLADLYQQAYKIYGAQNTTAQSATSSLNATQQGNLAKIESAGSAIDKLEQLYSQAGGGQGRFGGKITELGAALGLNSNASSYDSMARGLINQIVAAVGKTDALNNEGEVKRAMDLVPKITDTPEEAQIKLQSLREMLAANKQTYNNLYGVSQ